MTNAEKFLKDGVDLEEFSKSIMTWYFGNYAKANDYARIKNWAEHKIETLTEDERVILRNIDKKYTHIGRRDGTPSLELYIKSKNDFKHCWCFYNHLFQFIKERRRI